MHRVLMGKPEGKRPLEGGPDVDGRITLKMDLREVVCDLGYWIVLAENMDEWRAYVRAVLNLRVP